MSDFEEENEIEIVGEEDILEMYDFFTEFFDSIRSKPCRCFKTAFRNRKQYLTLDNSFCHIQVSSVFRSVPLDDKDVSGWSLDIVKITFNETVRRQGHCTRLFRWLRENTPTDFIFVQCVNTIEMRDFLVKHQLSFNASPRKSFDSFESSGYLTDWVIQK